MMTMTRETTPDEDFEHVLDSLDIDWRLEEDGVYRVDVEDRPEGDAVIDRIKNAIAAANENDESFCADHWLLDTWVLAEIPWSDFELEEPCWQDGTPVPYAVVITCPWSYHRHEFDVQVEGILEMEATRVEHVDQRWTIHYHAPADPDWTLSYLMRSLGWWQCIGRDFRAERCGSSTVVLEITS